jgi:predicted small integral membrane protein
VFGVAIFYSFVVFNNVTDYNSNYQFERHVMIAFSALRGSNLHERMGAISDK